MGLTREETARQALEKLNILPEQVNSMARKADSIYSPQGIPPLNEDIELNSNAKMAIGYADAYAIFHKAKEVTPIHLLMGIFRVEEMIRPEPDASQILSQVARERDIVQQLGRLSKGLEIDEYIDIVPTITYKIRSILEDPNIDQERKRLLTNIIINSIKLVEKAKRQPNF